MTFVLNESERRELYRQLVAKPAEEIHSLLLDQLSDLSRLKVEEPDPRRQILQSYVDRGDALKESEKEEDRQERRKSYAQAFLLGVAILDDDSSEGEQQSLYYRGSSFSAHYEAAAKRLLTSFLGSFVYLDDAAWTALRRLINPRNLWGLLLVLGGWFLATILGGWLGLAINAVLLGVGILDLWERLQQSWGSLREWFWLSYKAQKQAELDKAAKACAEGLAVGGLAVLEVVLFHFAFKALEAKVLERFKAPEWLARDFRKAAAARDALRQKADGRKTPPKKTGREKTPKEKPPRKEAEPREETKGGEGRKRSPGEGTRPIEATGAVRIAEEITDEAVWPWLVALGGAGVGLWWASRHRR